MATKLLNCLICPKRPDFSDASHLLTHVSSKGHLSHLHKLQVRSHQEIAAGHQLALYNQWYQEHDMGRLLSERMQQKDGKVVANRERVRQERTSMQAPVYSSNNVFENPVLVRAPRNIKPAKCELKQESSDDGSEYTSSPVKRNRVRRSTRVIQQAVNNQSRWEPDTVDSIEPRSSAAMDPEMPVTPEVAKLKGIRWPGMDLFDSASDIAKRKRNQKKDGSVLKQMERTSAMIKPYEIIYSSGGTKLKERFIDGNVDSSSPLRGETPIPKSQLPKKRQPLASVNTNIPRYTRTSTRISKPRTMAEVRSNAKPIKLPRTHAPSSSIEDLLETTPRFSPSSNDHLRFKLNVGNADGRKPVPNFTIYRDEDIHDAAAPLLGAQNPFNAVQNQVYSTRPQLSFITAPWLQPQNQYPHQMHYGNPYMAYTGDGRAYPEFDQQRSNPVSWRVLLALTITQAFLQLAQIGHIEGVPNHSSRHSPTQTNYTFFGGFNAQEDPFGYAKNPLSAAFDHLAPQVNAARASNNTCTPSPVKKQLASLDGTISDLENRKIYEQALFTSSQ